jgi:Phosphate transporter family
VVLSAGLAIALGTYLGGWRIIQTLGKRVSEIQTPQGFAAETASAAVILTSANLGFALSTTKVATGSIFGAAAGRRLSTVQWNVAGQLALAWLLTLPAAAVVGAVAAWAAYAAVVLRRLAHGELLAFAPPPRAAVREIGACVMTPRSGYSAGRRAATRGGHGGIHGCRSWVGAVAHLRCGHRLRLRGRRYR